MDDIVLDLLADRNPALARDFVLAWGERRNSTWADAAREASIKTASIDHLPHIRGQLRHHLGEIALATAAGAAKAGYMPVQTTPPGGVFVVARIGRLALVSLTVRENRGLPRKSITRMLMSQRNAGLDPQQNLLSGPREARGATELAYFGCVVAVPWRRDPKVPAELALAIPNAGVTEWLKWMSLEYVFAQLQDRIDSSTIPGTSIENIPDNVFPKFRLPKKRESEDDIGA